MEKQLLASLLKSFTGDYLVSPYTNHGDVFTKFCLGKMLPKTKQAVSLWEILMYIRWILKLQTSDK